MIAKDLSTSSAPDELFNEIQASGIQVDVLVNNAGIQRRHKFTDFPEKDWDDVIVNWVAEEFDKQHGENPLLDLQSYQDLYSRALTAKIQLSSRMRTTIVHSYAGKSVKLDLTRDDFEHRCRHLLEKCKTICEIVMQEAGLGWNGIDRILLTGGMFMMIGVYFKMLARRHGERPEDRNDGEISEQSGEQGVYAPWSWWPLVLGIAGALGFAALAIDWWIMAPAVVVTVIGLVGWVFEFSRGQHAH